MAKSEEEIRREQARARLEQRRARQQGVEVRRQQGSQRSPQRNLRPKNQRNVPSGAFVGGSRTSRTSRTDRMGGAGRMGRPISASRAGRAIRSGHAKRPGQPMALPISPKLLAIAGLVALLAVALIVRGCVLPAIGNHEGGSENNPAGSGSPAQTQDPIDQSALAAIMGDDLAAQMVANAEANPDLHWIAAHPDSLTAVDQEMQRKLLKLATVEPAAVSFVRNFGESYPDAEPEACDALASDIDIPLLQQWDARWGYTEYSGGAFGQTGCCPTCLSMVYQGITRKTDLSPYDLGQIAQEQGFVNSGTNGDFLFEVGNQIGLDANEIPAKSSNITKELAAGNVLVANVGPGDFTEGGHYIVLTGLDSNGNVIVNDPYSVVNSQKTWDPDVIGKQTKRLFIFYR